jgi:hypothetical protein
MLTTSLPVSLMCCIRAPKARLSALNTSSEKQLAISMGFPVSVLARGKRLVSCLNHSGA